MKKAMSYRTKKMGLTRILSVHCKVLVLAIAIAQSCKSPEPQNGLQQGDLLFQDLDCGALCDAIEAVTEGVNGKDFSHCGMVVKINDTLMVIEAIGDKVQLSSPRNFFRRSGDTSEIRNVTVGRLTAKYRSLIENASTYATQQLNQPYDDAFLLDNGRWYCSELLYESFKKANGGEDFFELGSMTFKDPKSGSFFPAWVRYYEQLNQDIPEGKPGLNPGSISRSDKIEIVNIHSL